MTGLYAALAASFAGLLGGVVNALLSDNGFALPRTAMTPDGGSILRPGMLGNCLIGAVAALTSWGLYGTAASVPVLSPATADITWAGFAGAVIVGIGGSRWLSAEVDKTLLKGAASAAAANPANDQLAAKLAILSPARALSAALAAMPSELRSAPPAGS